MPAPRMVSLKGSDFTGLGIECYGGLKDGIFVKKVAPQGPASGHINIGEFYCMLITRQIPFNLPRLTIVNCGHYLNTQRIIALATVIVLGKIVISAIQLSYKKKKVFASN